MPPKDIPFCHCITIPSTIMEKAEFHPDDSTSEKGDQAVRVVQWLLKAGRFPLWTHGDIIGDKDMQVQGYDIIVRMKARIQVKCDWRAGDKPGCTGNLFLQVRECNPFRQY